MPARVLSLDRKERRRPFPLELVSRSALNSNTLREFSKASFPIRGFEAGNGPDHAAALARYAGLALPDWPSPDRAARF